MAEFEIKPDFSNIDAYTEFIKTASKRQMQFVIKGVLNNQAFNTSDKAKKKTIPSSMLVRSKINQNSVAYTKAVKTGKDKYFADVGSRLNFGSLKNYTGLADIENGDRVNISGIPTVKGSRKGNIKNRVPKSKTYAGMNNFIKISGSKAPKMLANLARRKYKGNIYVRSGIPRLPKAIYKFYGKKISQKSISGRVYKGYKMIMIKDLSKDNVKIKQRKWLLMATSASANRNRTNIYFIEQMKRTSIFNKKFKLL
jgi:hypothetical protein